MYRIIALLLLAGCAAGGPTGGLRATNAAIYSSAVLEPGRMVGRWQQVGDFAQPGTAACKPGGAEILQGPNGLRVAARLCLAGKSTALSGALTPAGPGRFALAGQPVWWVLWADSGYRSLVIGTPSGAFGFVLDRGATLPPDRMGAAREVLDWNGYDLTKMR